MPPTLANGKICYIQIPATDVARSADFYRRSFGWNVRRRSDGEIAFDDTAGEVSGAWVLGRPPSSDLTRESRVWTSIGSPVWTLRSRLRPSQRPFLLTSGTARSRSWAHDSSKYNSRRETGEAAGMSSRPTIRRPAGFR